MCKSYDHIKVYKRKYMGVILSTYYIFYKLISGHEAQQEGTNSYYSLGEDLSSWPSWKLWLDQPGPCVHTLHSAPCLQPRCILPWKNISVYKVLTSKEEQFMLLSIYSTVYAIIQEKDAMCQKYEKEREHEKSQIKVT